MINRRSFIAAGGASLALAACGRAGASADLLRVGSQKGGTKSLMLAARVLDGIDYQVEWSEFPAAQNLLEALSSNAIDLGVAGDAPFLFAYESGSPIQAVAAQRVDTQSHGVLAVVARKGSVIRSLKDLRGKQVATGRGSIGHYLLLRAAQEAGWPADAIKIVFLSPSDAAAALAAGAVAAWATWGPYVALTLQQGGHIVVDGGPYSGGYSFEVANVSAVAAKQRIMRDFLSREAQALRWASSHVDAYAKVMAQETGLPLEIARYVVGQAHRSPVPIDAKVIADQRQVLDTFVHAGVMVAKRPLSQAFLPGMFMPGA